jgi:hypothetical protein
MTQITFPPSFDSERSHTHLCTHNRSRDSQYSQTHNRPISVHRTLLCHARLDDVFSLTNGSLALTNERKSIALRGHTWQSPLAALTNTSRHSQNSQTLTNPQSTDTLSPQCLYIISFLHDRFRSQTGPSHSQMNEDRFHCAPLTHTPRRPLSGAMHQIAAGPLPSAFCLLAPDPATCRVTPPLFDPSGGVTLAP